MRLERMIGIFVLLGILGLNACKVTSYPNEVTKVSDNTEPGTIFLRATGYGKNDFEVLVNAEKAAFNTLLFKGVPGTQQNLPMIPSETESKQQNPKFFENFFEKGGYKPFIVSSSPGQITKATGGKQTTADIKINIQSLRKYLEDNNIIRKFGY